MQAPGLGHRSISPQRVLDKTDYILGKDVELFEQEFAAYCNTTYAVGVDNGTSALEIVLKAYDIGPGDEVITVANTFMATVLSISYNGATPILVDIDPVTYQMDPAHHTPGCHPNEFDGQGGSLPTRQNPSRSETRSVGASCVIELRPS